jgi:linoleoyl-CoA desaturase
MLAFEWGVAFHDLDFDAIRKGEKSKKQVRRELKGIAGKARSQIVKDYIAWPFVNALGMAALQASASGAREIATGRRRRRSPLGAIRRRRSGGAVQRVALDALEAGTTTFRAAAKANFTANLVRNVWSYAIIFCGHFPDQTYTFTPEEAEDETRGGWYVRQLVGAANIEGSPLFHVASGNLGYQVEHHLFPDMPSSRYAEIAPRVKDICERYGLPYNGGPFMQQLGMVQRTILRLAFPGGTVREKPGPYEGGENGSVPRVAEVADRPAPDSGANGGDGSGQGRRSAGVVFEMPARG